MLFNGTATYVPGVSRHTSAGTRVYNPDFIGSNRVESDASGNAVATRVYDAYGNQTAYTGSPSSPFGFAGAFGYQEDGDSGLKLLGHRLYDPTAGRFITRDPAQSGSNWYAYCENNPLGNVDPDGLVWVYNQKTGHLVHINDKTGKIDRDLGYGFSGAKGPDRNNPKSQRKKNKGPITVGKYYIGKRRDYLIHIKDGVPVKVSVPYNLQLIPDPSNQMFGRKGFAIHGGLAAGDPSTGCMIFPLTARKIIDQSGDRVLIVWSGETDPSNAEDLDDGDDEAYDNSPYTMGGPSVSDPFCRRVY